ncbi:hypothetical protein [Acrocarpospora sp. B8E8]|uniref:allene oxide cyclase barrel-like domain-containing protein n=1 Tax=Acrocarpospora sp. B8E8 TaxID=3153572 RepID=UPI00325CBA8E
MSRFTIVSLTALMIAGLAAGLAVPARADLSGTVLHFIGQRTAAAQLDLGPAGGSLGDQVVFTGLLLDTQRRQVGHFEGVLTALDADGNRNQAQVTLALAAGQIAVQGELDFTAPQPFVHAVTGGTGRYADTGGMFSFRNTDQAGVIDITLDLRR